MKRPFILPIFPILLLLAFSAAVSAQEGKVRYEQLCGACHGNDGRGGQGGQHPPLADSAWVRGAPDRLIQVVLHGLMGEIPVPSKHSTQATYDLVMPPQGTLTDGQIAMILSYVRSSWGNNESPITAAMVGEQRKVTADRNGFWMADEILDRYPLRKDASKQPVKPPTNADVPPTDSGP